MSIALPRGHAPIFDGPTGVDPICERVYLDTKFAGQRTKRKRLANIVDHAVATQIVLLLRRRRPSTVSTKIAFGSVYPVNCGSVWALSHVRHEAVERQPFFADSNTSAAVARELCCAGIRASLLHGKPSVVRRRVLARTSVPVRRRPQAAITSAGAKASSAVPNSCGPCLERLPAASANNGYLRDRIHGKAVANLPSSSIKYCDGRVLAGLVKRRAAEAHLYLGGAA